MSDVDAVRSDLQRALAGEPIRPVDHDALNVVAARQSAEAKVRLDEHERREATKPAPEPRARPPELRLPARRPGVVVGSAATHSALNLLHLALAGHAAGLSAKRRRRLEVALAELDASLAVVDGPIRLD